MTRYDAIRRQLSDIEKHNERALAKLEDHVDIAAEIIADHDGISSDDALKLIAACYEVRQAARKAAVTT